jgi:hypothetical protein
LNLPEPIAQACEPLFSALPIGEAMSRLVGSAPVHTELVERVLADPAISGRADLAAGLWLYVDDLDRSHTISQSIEDETGSYWHGIMHRREGDFSNSHYWMRRAARHPLIAGNSEYDSDALIDDVSRAKGDDASLVGRQRTEWQNLFEWCANHR